MQSAIMGRTKQPANCYFFFLVGLAVGFLAGAFFFI